MSFADVEYAIDTVLYLDNPAFEAGIGCIEEKRSAVSESEKGTHIEIRFGRHETLENFSEALVKILGRLQSAHIAHIELESASKKIVGMLPNDDLQLSESVAVRSRLMPGERYPACSLMVETLLLPEQIAGILEPDSVPSYLMLAYEKAWEKAGTIRALKQQPSPAPEAFEEFTLYAG